MHFTLTYLWNCMGSPQLDFWSLDLAIPPPLPPPQHLCLPRGPLVRCSLEFGKSCKPLLGQNSAKGLLRSDKAGRMYRLNTPHITKRHKMELKSYVALKRKTPVHGQWRNDRCLMEGSWRKKRRRSLLGVLFFWGPVGWGIVSSIQWRDCRSTDLSSCFLCWDERPSSFGWRSRS